MLHDLVHIEAGYPPSFALAETVAHSREMVWLAVWLALNQVVQTCSL